MLLTTAGDGKAPCSNCLRQSRPCAYPLSRRGKRSKPSKQQHSRDEASTRMSDLRMVPYQPLRNGQTVNAFATAGESQEPVGSFTSVPIASQGFSTSPTMTCSITNPGLGDSQGLDSGALTDSYLRSVPPTTGSSLLRTSDFTAQAESEAPSEQQDQNEEPVNSPGQYWEHHGPWSWLSVCSQPGIRWVCDRTHSEDFVEVANDLTKALSRRLRLKLDQVRSRCSDEPNEDLAWRYVNGGCCGS